MKLLDEADEGLLLATEQVYSPPVVTVRVWVYIACSHWVIQHSLSSFSDDSGGVSGPRYRGSRSTSGDTGEGQLVRVIRQVLRYDYIS